MDKLKLIKNASKKIKAAQKIIYSISVNEYVEEKKVKLLMKLTEQEKQLWKLLD